MQLPSNGGSIANWSGLRHRMALQTATRVFGPTPRWTSSQCCEHRSNRMAELPPAPRHRSQTDPAPCCWRPKAPSSDTPRPTSANNRPNNSWRRRDHHAHGTATHKLLDRNGLSINDIDLFEINEAFASVVVAWQRELTAHLDRVNVNGGALALGHPAGASGARLVATIINELQRSDKELGLVSMCCGGGFGTGTIIQRC
jgi:hypothetical protein